MQLYTFLSFPGGEFISGLSSISSVYTRILTMVLCGSSVSFEMWKCESYNFFFFMVCFLYWGVTCNPMCLLRAFVCWCNVSSKPFL